MGGKYTQVGQSSDMQFMDPTGQYSNIMNASGQQGANYQSQMNQFLGPTASVTSSYDPEAAMRAFLGQADGLSNLVSGQNSQLQQSLNAIAQRQANLGGEAALASMPGLRNSGAAMAAYGQAYADPFAQAQAQLQQNQLQGTLGLWNQALGQYGDAYKSQGQFDLQGQMANQSTDAQYRSNMANLFGGLASGAYDRQAGMAQNASAWYQPQYQYQKGVWDYALDATQMGANVASIFA